MLPTFESTLTDGEGFADAPEIKTVFVGAFAGFVKFSQLNAQRKRFVAKPYASGANGSVRTVSAAMRWR